MKQNPPKPVLLVTGDAHIAWDLVHDTGDANSQQAYAPESASRVYRQAGGAWHLSQILEKMLRDEWTIHGVAPNPKVKFLASLDQVAHSYAVWTDFPLSDSANDKVKATRVKGYWGSVKRRSEGKGKAPWKAEFDSLANTKSDEIKLIVVSDDGLEDYKRAGRINIFDKCGDLFKNGKIPWILWKDRGLGRTSEHNLIGALSAGKDSNLPDGTTQENIYKKTIGIASIDTLRRQSYRVGHGLSWESLASETFQAVIEQPELKKCHMVIVSFHNAGALIVENLEGDVEAHLVFDPAELERTWTARYKGNIVGSTTCIVATVAKGLAEHIKEKKENSKPLKAATLVDSVREGLLCMRALHYLGYYSKPEHRKNAPSSSDATDNDYNPTTTYLTNPWDQIYKDYIGKEEEGEVVSVQTIKKAIGEKGDFICLKVSRPALQHDSPWELQYRHSSNSTMPPSPRTGQTFLEAQIANSADGFDLPRNIVIEGPKKALNGYPRANYGQLITTNPGEIDELQAISTILEEYARNPGDKPLSIAVFGQPGSGKSFGISQIASQLGQVFSRNFLTFNLSQFSSADMLIGAFHQIRDIGISGKIPLVFWDEFDTQLAGVNLGWLRYFLAPMQDGNFQEAGSTHSIGRAVFVFAGGTCASMEAFKDKSKMNADEYRERKVPDFLSRLRGSLNVPGLNPDATGDNLGVHLEVRRALILRQHLYKIKSLVRNERVQIDDSVLHAFIKIKRYEHGARSMEALVRMSNLSGAQKFTASLLPSAAQLNLPYIPQVAELISRGFQSHVFYEYPETSTAVDKRAG